MTATLRLRLFGVPGLLDGSGAPVKLRSAKQLGALLYLALEGREQPVTRDRLVDLLWSDVPPELGRHSLAQTCSAIRGALGPDALSRANGSLRLAAALETDLDVITGEFDRLPLTDPLREAEWWAGPEFAHWVDGARGRLRRSAEDALRRAVGDFRRQGQTALVHAAAAVLYQLDPLSDTAVHALAERDLMAGDVVGAIRLLRAHLARVKDALGCAPHRDVERLLRRLEAGSHPPVEPVPARLAAEASTLRPSVFVGREKELALLEAEWQQVGEGGFRSCLVLGPAGMGKSSLVRRFAAMVVARARPTFVVTCQEIGEGIPFAALSDLITALTEDPSVSATDPNWLAEVARIHPALRLRYPGIPQAPDAPPDSIRLRVAGGILQMLDAVSDGAPIGIIYDDLPFMDPATRDVMHIIGRRLNDRPVLFIATARTPQLLETTTLPFPGISIVDWNTVERLLPLDGQSIRQMASALSPGLASDPRTLERIEHISDGNPHFTEMLVADWERHATQSLAGTQAPNALPDHWQPPDSLRKAFARAYLGLNVGARDALQILAVAGRGLKRDELSRSLISEHEQLDCALLELIERGIVRIDNGLLAFKNELHRAFVYYSINGDLRRFVHTRLARGLMSRSADNYLSSLEASRHLQKGGLHAEAATVVLEAAHQAIENGAPAEAESALRMVLATKGSPETKHRLEILLAESLSAQGHYEESLSLIDAVEPGLLDTKTQVIVSFLRAQALQRIRTTDDESIEEAAQHALRLAEASDSARLLAATAQIVAEAASEMGIPAMLAQAVDTTRRLREGPTSEATRAQALLTAGFCAFNIGQFDEGVRLLNESVRLLTRSRLESELTRALNGQALCLMALGRHREAIRPLATAARISAKLSDAAHCSTILTNMGALYEDVGMFAESEACHLQAISQDPSGRNPRPAANCQVNAVQAALIRGDLNAAMSRLAVAKDAAMRSQSWRLSTLVDFTEADVLMAIGEPERAWPIITHAATQTWGRERSLDTNGKAIRLTLHCALATAGKRRLEELVKQLIRSRPPVTLAQSLEIGGFLAWTTRTGELGEAVFRESGFAQDFEALPGPLAVLAAVGISPKAYWSRQAGETAIQMINRVVPIGQRESPLPVLRDVPLES